MPIPSCCGIVQPRCSAGFQSSSADHDPPFVLSQPSPPSVSSLVSQLKTSYHTLHTGKLFGSFAAPKDRFCRNGRVKAGRSCGVGVVTSVTLPSDLAAPFSFW